MLSPEGVAELAEASFGEEEWGMSLVLEYEVFVKKQRRFGFGLGRVVVGKKMMGLWGFQELSDDGRGEKRVREKQPISLSLSSTLLPS